MAALYEEERRQLFVFLIILALAAGTAAAASDVSFYPSAEAAAAAHCDGTLYPELCLSTLATIPDLHKKPLPDVICSAINRTETDVTAMSANCSAYLRERSLIARDRLAVSDCMELLDTTMDDLHATTSDLQQPVGHPTHDHVMTILSAAITNQETCLEGFSFQKGGEVRRYMEPGIRHISRMVSNSLAMAKKLPLPSPKPSTLTLMESVQRVRQPFTGYGQMVKGFPRWVKPGDRRLLQAPASGINADAVVAKDGSGAYTTVSAAVAAAPVNSKSRYVIYIKAGAYMENVEVAKNQKNLMFIGDGMGKTVIKASRNVVDGSTTFHSATVASWVTRTHCTCTRSGSSTASATSTAPSTSCSATPPWCCRAATSTRGGPCRTRATSTRRRAGRTRTRTRASPSRRARWPPRRTSPPCNRASGRTWAGRGSSTRGRCTWSRSWTASSTPSGGSSGTAPSRSTRSTTASTRTRGPAPTLPSGWRGRVTA